ncbi:MAG TPA: hypothetical protein VK590_03055 [Saprospiraceae bacterium]|nr:hypothetical protein [Saprospiraceae bacterium]
MIIKYILIVWIVVIIFSCTSLKKIKTEVNVNFDVRTFIQTDGKLNLTNLEKIESQKIIETFLVSKILSSNFPEFNIKIERIIAHEVDVSQEKIEKNEQLYWEYFRNNTGVHSELGLLNNPYEGERKHTKDIFLTIYYRITSPSEVVSDLKLYDGTFYDQVPDSWIVKQLCKNVAFNLANRKIYKEILYYNKKGKYKMW